jgi:transposase
MWKPYLRVIAKKAGQAIHVLDRFHIMAHLSKAIDEVRAEEVKDLKARGYEPVLKRARWLLLKRPENLTETQDARLADLLRYNLR